jgi:putative membrane protein
MRTPRIIIVAVVAVLVLILIIQNTDAVETKLLFVTVTLPRAVLLGVTLVVGWLLGLITSEVIDRPSRAKAKADKTG